MNPPQARKLGTVGTPLLGQTIKLFGVGNWKEAPSGEEAEICITGPSLMKGYVNAEDQPITNGWLRTGDLGRFDDDGYLSITGRVKEIIVRGGENYRQA